jgi:NAD(P)-dependent dehydrogenase (short-subunit alcohol dehydrogenase family)
MAVEYAPHKIRVNAIAPSVTLTDRVRRLLAGNAGVSKLAESHLLGLGQPIHIADMAVYLASDEAAITTGQILSVDSGVTIY